MQNLTKRLLWALIPLAFAGQAGAADIRDRSIKVSHVVPSDHPYHLGVIKFGELVSQKSSGKIKVRGYPDGQLGAEVASISSAQGGILEMAVVATAAAGSVVKEFGVYDLPFLFNNHKETDFILDGPIGRMLLGKLSDKGLIGLCYFENGFRHVTNSKRPIARLEDLNGLKIRTIQNAIFIDVFKGLGANPTPMPFTEVYTALETKAIDGQETPYSNIFSNRFFEVQKYVSGTGHIYGSAVVLVSKKFWDQLSGDEKTMLQSSCDAARDYERQVNREQDPKFLEQLKAKGMAFNEIAPEERARMRDALKPIYDKHTKELGEDVVKQVLAELQKVRALNQ
jgi:TRAP-type transport system periplasmic protein